MSTIINSGQLPRAERRKIIHRTKLFNGESAEDVHQKYAFPKNAKCGGCTNRPMTRVMTFIPLDELMKRDPMFQTLAEHAPEKVLAMIVQFKGSDGKGVPHVRIATQYACKNCTPALERAAVRAPSWAVVEIHRGVGPDKIVVGTSWFGDEQNEQPVAEKVAAVLTADPLVERAVANMPQPKLTIVNG